MLINHAILLDFFFGLFLISMFWFSAILMYRLYQNYPFQILRYFIWGWVISPITFVSSTLLLLLTMVFELNYEFITYWNYIFLITYCISILGIGLYGIGLLLVIPKTKTVSIPINYIIIGGLIGYTMASVTLKSTFDFSGYNGDINFTNNPFVSFGLLLMSIFLSFYAFKHYQSLTKIRNLDQSIPPFTTKYLPLAYIFLLIGFIYLGIENSTSIINDLPETFWPLKLSLTFSLFLGISGLFFTKALIKFPNLIIITPAKINHFLFVSKTSLPLYSYDSESHDTDTNRSSLLFSGLFSALDITLSETIGSESGLTSINFGDKIIKIDRRNDFTLYTILTELNSVTIDITRTLADQFEKIFQNELDNLKGKKLKFVNTSIFDGFILNIQNFLFFAPLSRKK